MTTLTIPAKTLSEAVSRLVSMSDRANATFSRTTGLLVQLNPEATTSFAHCRVANGTVRYSEYMPCKVEGAAVSWRLPIHELARITSGMTDDAPVTLSDGQPQLRIAGPGLKAKIPMIADLDFLSWEMTPPKQMHHAAELFANIHSVEWAAERSFSLSGNTTAVHFSPKLIAATDRYSMAFAEVDYPDDFGSGMVDAAALRSIPRLGYAPLVKFTEQAFVIQCSPYAQASISLTAAEPLNFESLLKAHTLPEGQAKFDAKELISTLKRAQGLAGLDRQVDMTFSAEHLTFTAGDDDGTIGQFGIEGDISGIDANCTIRIDTDRLSGALREANGGVLIAFDPESNVKGVHVHTSRSRAVIMPIRKG